MVKIDYDRDYYGDLELSPSATTQDVKNQFKKLALKWHPDRNHGREDEAKIKFVVIQSAQEVLVDSTKRAKYDAERKSRQNRYPTASGMRGNPWQDLSAQYPVPPKRASQRPSMPTRPPMPAHPSVPPRPAASGASRYASFAKPTVNQGSPRTDPNQNARAWENMRPSNAMPGQQAKPASQSASVGSTPCRAKADAPPTTPRTKFQQQKAEASFGARRGFVPASPGGDERPAANKHYSTTRARAAPYDDLSYARFAAASEMDQTENTTFDTSQFAARERTPYTSHTRERTTLYPAKTERQQVATTPTAPSRPRRVSIDASPFPKMTSHDASSDNTTAKKSHAPRPVSTANTMPKSAPTTATCPPHAATGDGMQGKFDSAFAKPQGNATIFTFQIDESVFQTARELAHRDAMQSGSQYTSTQSGHGRATQEYQFQAGGHSTEPDDPFTAARRSARARMKAQRSDVPLNKLAYPPPGKSGDKEVLGGAEKKAGTFNADEWTAQIGSQNFVPPRALASPTCSRPMKKPKAGKNKTTVGGSARMVEDDESSSEDKPRQQAATVQDMGGAPSPNAMDIDAPETGPGLARSASARNIPVEPSRPEWRAGQVHDAKPGDAGHTPAADTRAAHVQPTTVAGSEDCDDMLQPNNVFSNFAKSFQGLEPLVAPAAGLSSFNDLKSSLPFPSQAAPTIHIAPNRPKSVLDFPAKPAAPRPPVAGLLPTHREWQRYDVDFMAYMAQWMEYQGWFADFFAARHRQLERGRRANGFALLDARGDDGLQEYMHWIEQGKLARQTWAVACDGHEAFICDLARSRNMMKR